MKCYGISKTRSQFTPGEFTTGFTTHNTASSQSSHYNHLSNPSSMYCRTYVKSYDAAWSVIPCDKLHKHQLSFNSDGEQRPLFDWEREFQHGGNFSVSWDRNFPNKENQLRVNFEIFSDSWCHADKLSSWIESLFLSNKMIDFKYQTQQKKTFVWRENRHLLILMHGHWRRGQFSHGWWVWRFGGIWSADRYYV